MLLINTAEQTVDVFTEILNDEMSLCLHEKQNGDAWWFDSWPCCFIVRKTNQTYKLDWLAMTTEKATKLSKQATYM